MIADELLGWMRRKPVDGLCAHCHERPGITDDGDLTACMPCVLRLGDRARRPVRFEDHELADLERAHQEVAYIVACRQHRLEWTWTRSWPSAGDDQLVAPETAWRVVGDAYLIAARHG